MCAVEATLLQPQLQSAAKFGQTTAAHWLGVDGGREWDDFAFATTEVLFIFYKHHQPSDVCMQNLSMGFTGPLST